MMKLRRLQTMFTALLIAVAVSGCAGSTSSSCPAGLKTMMQAELFFGRAIAGGGQVGEEDWRHFLDEEVTPRFPDGLTVQDASGQWRSSGGIVREQSKRLTIVLSGTGADLAKLDAIRTAYQRRFHQDSVLLVENRVCAGF